MTFEVFEFDNRGGLLLGEVLQLDPGEPDAIFHDLGINAGKLVANKFGHLLCGQTGLDTGKDHVANLFGSHHRLSSSLPTATRNISLSK
jgi:hypothetical protein